MNFTSIIRYPWNSNSSTTFKVCFDPYSDTITDIKCSSDDGRPCSPCKEFRELQPKISKAQARVQKWERRNYVQGHVYNGYKSELEDHQKHDVKVRLLINDRHDPMNRLPVELRAEIFEIYSHFPRVCYQRLPQITLLSVCKQWREVAINTPRLWTTFSVPSITRVETCVDETIQWLLRSKPYPISLEFKRPSRDINYLCKPPRRWISDFPIESQEQDIASTIKWRADIRNRVYALHLETLPRLKDVMISEAFGEDTIWPMLSHITMKTLMVNEAVEVLRRCPQATVVEFIDLCGDSRRANTRVRVTHLRSLKLEFCEFVSSSYVTVRPDPAAFLDYIVAPALKEVICQSTADISPLPALEKLFRRSACFVHTLHFGLPSFRHDELISLLESQPSLRNFTIVWRSFYQRGTDDATRNAFDGFMRLLITDKNNQTGIGRQYTTGNFLPRLEVIKYIGKMRFSWETLRGVYYSHAGILENRNREGLARPTFRPETQYRPLRLLKFQVFGEHLPSHWSHLISLPSSPDYCRFEYDVDVDNEKLVYMYY